MVLFLNGATYCVSLLQILATAMEDSVNSYLLHRCVFQCDAVTVSQYGLFEWENIDSTLRQDTGKPTLQTHAHSISDKPKRKIHSHLFLRLNNTCTPTQTQYEDFFYEVLLKQQPSGSKSHCPLTAFYYFKQTFSFIWTANAF